jgi:hypothetical protein
MENLKNRNSEIPLSSCSNWSDINNCCKSIYDSNITCKVFPNIKLNINDFDKNCNGKSNSSLCVWFRGVYLRHLH